MSKLRKHHDRNYTVLDNAGLRDERLSWAARGILAYLYSLPDDWNISIANVAKAGPTGETIVRNAMTELATFGYLKREREPGTRGLMVTITYVSDTPLWAEYGTVDERVTGIYTDPPSCGGSGDMGVILSKEILSKETSLEPSAQDTLIPIEPVATEAATPPEGFSPPSKKKKEPVLDSQTTDCLLQVMYGYLDRRLVANAQWGMMKNVAKKLQAAGVRIDQVLEWYNTVWTKTWPGNTGRHPNATEVVAGMGQFIEAAKQPTVTEFVEFEPLWEEDEE